METRLKQIRRAAGDARDCDVLAQRLSECHSDAEAQRFLEKIRSRRRRNLTRRPRSRAVTNRTYALAAV